MTLAQLNAKAAEYRRGQLEGGEGYNPYDTMIEAECDRLAAVERAEFEAEWTVEITTARRVSWNDMVRAGKIRSIHDVKAAEKTLGWTWENLKRAIKVNGL